LSVDGGKRFAVRLTRELSGDATSYAWRVPLLPSGAARLALRANLDGHEMEVGESAPFAITSGIEAESASAGSIRFLDGEIWWQEGTVAGSEGERLALAGFDSPPAESRVLPSAGESMLAEARSPDFEPRPAAGSTHVPRLLAASGRPAPARPSARIPLLSPLRI
ncbi:MAG TPA: hypothetical protein VN851_09930, partial [Thermoanaerobaculia bacterium]|nr:hypothetical protein [Thermoanaerobaculia bacterium]